MRPEPPGYFKAIILGLSHSDEIASAEFLTANGNGTGPGCRARPEVKPLPRSDRESGAYLWYAGAVSVVVVAALLF